MSEAEPVRVCLLVDGETIPEWAHAAVERMVEDAPAEVTVVVSNRRDPRRSTSDRVRRAIELREWTLVWLFRSMVADPIPLSDPVSVIDHGYAADAEWIDCRPERVDGWKNAIPAPTVDRIVEKADVAVRFGFGFLVGEILNRVEYGVLSYHHGNFQEYRGQPAGCWEFIHGRSEVGITLQQLTDQLDAGRVVTTKAVSIDDARTFSEIRGRLYTHSADMLGTAVSQIAEGTFDPTTVDELGPIYTIPRGWPALRFFRKEFRGQLQQIVAE